MNRSMLVVLYFIISFLQISCNYVAPNGQSNPSHFIQKNEEIEINLLNDIDPLLEDGDINAIGQMMTGTPLEQIEKEGA